MYYFFQATSSAPPISSSCSNISSSNALSSDQSEAPIFEFCKPRKNITKTQSYPAKPLSSPVIPERFPQHHSAPPVSVSLDYGTQVPKPQRHRRSSCFSLSPTIVTPDRRSEMIRGSLDELKKPARRNNSLLNRSIRSKRRGSNASRQQQVNKSQGCLNDRRNDEDSLEAEDEELVPLTRNERNLGRKSTSDLTELEDNQTMVTMLSSPRRRGSMKGGLGKIAKIF